MDQLWGAGGFRPQDVARAIEEMGRVSVERERRKLMEQYNYDLQLKERELRQRSAIYVDTYKRKQEQRLRHQYPDFFGPKGPGAALLSGGDFANDGAGLASAVNPQAVASFTSVTGDSVPGYTVDRVFGSLSSSHVYMDPDTDELDQMDSAAIAQRDKLARDTAQAQLVRKAIATGANALIAIRFDRSPRFAHAYEIMAYGTAVKIKKEENKPSVKEGNKHGELDPADLLRWALTGETKTSKKQAAQPKKEEFTYAQLKAVVNLIADGYQPPKPETSSAWSSNYGNNNNDSNTSWNQGGTGGGGGAWNGPKWGGWAEELSEDEEEEDDRGDGKKKEKQSTGWGIADKPIYDGPGQWIHKPTTKKPEMNRRLDRFYTHEDWKKESPLLADTLLSGKTSSRRDRKGKKSSRRHYSSPSEDEDAGSFSWEKHV